MEATAKNGGCDILPVDLKWLIQVITNTWTRIFEIETSGILVRCTTSPHVPKSDVRMWVCVCVGFVMCGCFDNFVGVFIICVPVFTVFCIV